MSHPSCIATKKADITMDNKPKTTRMNGVNAQTSFKMSLNFIFIPLSRILEAKIIDKIVRYIIVRLPFEWVLRRSLWFIPVRVGIPVLRLT